MLSLFVKNKSIFNNFIFILSIVLIITFYFLRINHGVDFSDEMQYLHQFKSIYQKKKLFADDYFIQQFVYVYLIYPFKILENLFPSLSLLYLLRLCTIIFALIVFINLFQLKKIDYVFLIFSSFIIYLDRLGITPNYNSFSYIFGFVFIFNLYIHKTNIIFLSILNVIVLSINPPVGFFLLLLFLTIEYTESKKINLKFISFLFLNSLIILLLLFFLKYLNINELISAINFSKNVSNFIILGVPKHLILLGLYLLLFLILFIYRINYNSFNVLFIRFRLFIYFLILIIYITLSFSKYYEISYIFLYFSLFLILIHRAYQNIDNRKFIFFLSPVFLILIIAFTSGNGIYRSQTGIMYFLPILIFELYKTLNKERFINISIFLLFLVLMYITYTKTYRIPMLHNNNFYIDKSQKDIGGMYVFKEQYDTYNEIKSKISLSSGETLTVIGIHPWIYSIYPSTYINTAMVFHHVMDDFILNQFNLREKSKYIILSNDFSYNSSYQKNYKLFVNSLNNYNCHKIMLDNEIVSNFNKNYILDLINPITICEENK